MRNPKEKTDKSKGPVDEKVMNCIQKFNKLESDRRILDTAFDEIAEYFMPRKQNILNRSSLNPVEKESRLFDTTAGDSLLTAAAGLMSWSTPKSEPWFSFEAPRNLRNNTAVRKWLNECTQIAQELLANSNYYSQRHESLIDKLAFGTSALFSQVTEDGETYFENVNVGTYVIEENFKGVVDTLMRKIQLTPRQAVQQFGEENLDAALCDEYKNNKTDLHDFIHVVRPREKSKVSEDTVRGPLQLPFESFYIHSKSQTIVKEGGFETFPFHVGRYLAYTGTIDKTPWGYGPGFMALPEARQLNYLQKMMDVYMGKAIFPPMLVPNTFEGALDVQAKAINYYNPDVGTEQFKMLEVTGDFAAAQDRIQLRRRAIETKFHVDLFQMLSSRPGTQPLTAEEVRALQNEKLDAISPAFDRDVTEQIEPMLQRLFGSWSAAGMFPPPPPEAIISVDENSAYGIIPNPNIVMGGRLALAIKNLRNNTTDMQMRRVGALAAFDPTIIDNIDMDKLIRGTSFDSGFNAEYLRGDEDVAMMRKQRAEAQAQQAQLQQMLEMGKVAGPENVGKLVESNM